MSKYTKEELMEMAKFTISRHDVGDPKAMLLIFTVSEISGIPPNECLNRIKKMAETGDWR